MNRLHNNKKTLLNRRSLRRDQTDAERKFWYFLRGGRFLGLKFYRQYGIGPFILDLYCHEKRLAIELDGGQHNEQAAYDENRTSYLMRRGIKVIRFWNHDVLLDVDVVLEKLRLEIEGNPSQPPLAKGRNSF